MATVNYPLAYFAGRLGGDAVDVLFDVPEGRDPAFWRPGLKEIGEIQSADLIVLNGAGFAEWTTKVSLPRSRLVDTSDGFSNAFIATESITHSHGTDGEHSHTGTASYTWLDFEQAARQATALAEAMKRRLPALEDVDERLAALVSDLKTLDDTAGDVGSALAGKTILTTHPRYQYFARAYGLAVDSFDWAAGAMPTDEQWRRLAERVDGTDATVLIWEAAPPDAALSRAEEMGLASVVLSPLAARPETGDFLSVMSDALASLMETADR